MKRIPQSPSTGSGCAGAAPASCSPAAGKTTSLEKWQQSADAWLSEQGSQGDWSRRAILDPALEQLLPDLSGKQVLDLGCGEGRYSRILKAKGAKVIGIDPVPKFLEVARTRDPDSTYIEAFAEEIPVEDASCDLVLSYLSLVDIPDLSTACSEIRRLLKPGGAVVIVNISNLASMTEGWVKDAQGRKLHRVVDRYMEHFAMDLEWREIAIRNYHRPLSFIFGQFLNDGFVLKQFVEPLPAPEDPNYADEFRAPNFQIYAFEKVGHAEARAQTQA